jgi:transcriptional regulator with XRE-family HTH domain
MNVGRGIRKAFEASGLNLTQFAKKAGVPLSTAHGWLNATHGIRLHKLPKIAKALGTTVAELVA